MIMNKHAVLLSAAVVLLLSCSREADHNLIQPGETITFTAAWADTEGTRTILQSDGTSVWWDAYEQINLFFSNKASGRFTSTNSQPQSIVDFQGYLPITVGSIETDNPAHAYWAVYPYNAANTCDGESVTLTIPTTQTAVAGSFDNKMFPSIATSTNFYLAFYNVCGGARFSVYNEGITSVIFKANNDESLAGKVQVGFDAVPVIQNVLEGESEVTVNAPEGGFIPGQYYFVTLLPQTLTKGVSLTFRKPDGKIATTSIDNSITINRSRFGKIDGKDQGLDFVDDESGDPIPTLTTDISEFNSTWTETELVVKVYSNVEYTSTRPTWIIEKSRESGTEGGKTVDTIVYSILENDDFLNNRSGVITFSQIGGNLVASVAINQEKAKPLEVVVSEAGTLLNQLDINTYQAIKGLKISGEINGTDVIIIRRMSDLSYLDLSDVRIKAGGSSYYHDYEDFYIEKDNEIGACMFIRMQNLKTCIIPDTITIIRSGAFAASGLEAFDIPNSVKTIESYAFQKTNLKSIYIPDSVILADNDHGWNCGEESVFDGCQYLETVRIPSHWEAIPYSYFWGCYKLTSINLPEGLVSLEEVCLCQCWALKDIILPSTLKKIGKGAFYLDAIETITIPSNVETIEEKAFANCSSLREVHIQALPEKLTNISTNIFEGLNKNLITIYVPKGTLAQYIMTPFGDFPNIIEE